jgi:hypothetical protein
LEVNGQFLRIRNDNNTGEGATLEIFNNGGGGVSGAKSVIHLGRVDDSARSAKIGVVGVSTNMQNPALFFETAGTERMRIDTSGNVGIGTSSPGATMHASAPLSAGEIVNVGMFSQLSNSNPTVGQGARITLAANSSTLRCAAIQGAHESGTNAHYLAFLTSADLAAPTERMRITSAGRVGIVVTTPSFLLELPNVASDAGGRGRANQWATYSDGRIKSNREALPYGLDAVMQLEPLKYFQHNSKTNEDGELEILDEGAESIGLVAQDVAAIIPEIVSVPEDLNKDLCSMDYAKLTTVLVNAIKEQQAIIEQLKADVAALKGAQA